MFFDKSFTIIQSKIYLDALEADIYFNQNSQVFNQ